MGKIIKRVLYTLIVVVLALVIFGFILAYLPTQWKIQNRGITPVEAAILRQNYTGPHNEFTTTDGKVLFLRRWNPDTLVPEKRDIAVLIFHGFTAYSGPYSMAGDPISAGGYTVFGLDYRGHGLSDGNRGDSPGKERWISDLAESVKYLKTLGFKRVVILGHSLGVASAICAADTVPAEISGLILLSGAYEGRKGLTKPPTLFQKTRILASSIFRPSYQAVEYYRDGMSVSPDTLFTYRYTLRFLTLMDVKQLRLPQDLNIPVLVGVGDKDELFEIDKVKDFYDSIPGNKKGFFVMKNATHAKIPLESWQEIVAWLDKTFVSPTSHSLNI
jgi:alpha-beta hydrolase superfamily lysophospholipase